MDRQRERDAAKGNEQTFVTHLARQLMRQDSWLTLAEATVQARRLYAQGVRDLWA